MKYDGSRRDVVCTEATLAVLSRPMDSGVLLRCSQTCLIDLIVLEQL